MYSFKIPQSFFLLSDTRSLSLTSDSEEDVLNRSQNSGENSMIGHSAKISDINKTGQYTTELA